VYVVSVLYFDTELLKKHGVIDRAHARSILHK